MLNEDQIYNFKQDGFVVIPDLIEKYIINKILNNVKFLTSQVAKNKSYNLDPCSEDVYLQLSHVDRNAAGKIFDTLVKIPELQRFCYSKHLENYAKQLLKTKVVLASPYQQNLRSDMPKEEKFLYPWHRDYDYNQSSTNSLVFWVPLQDTDFENGSLHLLKGSHESKVNTIYKLSKTKNSANYFKVENIDNLINNCEEVRCNLKVGDGIVFDSKLIHKSGVNNSSSIRYAIQSRWFDPTSFDSIEKIYRGGIDEGINPKEYMPYFIEN